MDAAVFLLSTIVFLPALAAIVLAFVPGDKHDVLRWSTLVVTVLVLLIVVLGLIVPLDWNQEVRFRVAADTMQNAFVIPWIPSFNIYYFMGMDGISFPLIALTALISLLAMGASWTIKRHVKAYCILFLLLVTGMMGVFLALDFFLFYVFWEVMLLPMYFLIGVWGGPRKEYAAIKFFLYTLVGSVLILIAILMLYFASDLSDPRLQPHLEGVPLSATVQAQIDEAVQREVAGEEVYLHTFNILALQQIGQHTDQFRSIEFLGWSLEIWAFLLLLIGFIIKVPSVPLHTWLPDAHVEAPTPISMILAGILLKMGGYGIIRICYPICPLGGYELAYFVCLIGVISMVYGAFAAMAQKDFKRLVAYSSVSHMGYVVLGLGVWSATAENLYNSDYWNMGVQGAMFQMIAHGISSAGMFFLVGVIYERVHHRNLDEFGGLFGRMPMYTAMSIGIFFAGLGLPGLCGFIGEVVVVLSVWNYSIALAVIAAAVVILTAAYILWTIQRVYLGPEYKGPHGEHLHGMTTGESSIALTLFVLAILLGVFPRQTVLRYMDRTVEHQVRELTEWTMREEGMQPVAGVAQRLPNDLRATMERRQVLRPALRAEPEANR